MSNFKRKTASGFETITIDADKLGGMSLEQIQALINGLVTLSTQQTITGKKTFNAPANSNGTEQATVIIKTANGGQIIFGKEGPNSGSMIGLDQVAGTRRLNFRASATPGAIVWSQPESNSSLFFDVTNMYFRECASVVFSKFANASALGTDSGGNLKKVSLAAVATSGKYSDLSGKPTIDTDINSLTSGHIPDSGAIKVFKDDYDSNSKSIWDTLNPTAEGLINLEKSLSDYRKKSDDISSDAVTCNIRDQEFDQGTLSDYLDELYDRIYTLQNKSVPNATSSAYGTVKLGSDTTQNTSANSVTSTASRTYAIQKDSSGRMVVNVPWTSGSSSSYSLPEASSTVRGGVMLTAGHSGDSNVYESYFDVKVESTNYHVFIRAGRFKQTSGSASSTTQFTFKKAMTTFGSSASKVSVILGDSSGQSTSGGYMGSLAVDSASSTGFKYRASNTEKGYVFYLALGTY